MAQSDQQKMSGGEGEVGGDSPGLQQAFNPFSEAGLYHHDHDVGLVHRHGWPWHSVARAL